MFQRKFIYLLQKIFDDSTMIVFCCRKIHHDDFDLIYYNENFKKTLMYDDEFLKNTKFQDLLHAKEKSSVFEKLDQSSTDEKIQFVASFKGKGDEYIDFIIDAIFLNNNNRNNSFNFLKNKKETVLFIANQIENLQNIEDNKLINYFLNYLDEVHYIENLSSRKFIHLSENIKDLTGFSKEELNYQKFREQIDPEDKDRILYDYSGESFNNDLKNNLTYRFIKKDGGVIWLNDIFTVITGKDGSALYTIGSLRDVTNLKEKEEQILNLQQQLAQKQKMEALGRFSSEIAHDFNNILSGIKANGELLYQYVENLDKFINSIKKLNIDEKYLNEIIKIKSELSDSLEDLAEIITKALSLTSNLLTFSRIKSNMVEKLDLNEVLVKLKLIIKNILKKGVNIDVQTLESPLYIETSRTNIEQILLNLVINSIDAIKENGNITIKTEKISKEEDRRLRISQVEKKFYAKITIKDDGSGIPEELRSRIFEPFFTTKKNKGTGLGLSIVYSLVQQADGYIDFESSIGNGTTFFIYFPIVE